MIKENSLTYARLHLHIQHPNLEDCWLEGYESVEDNVSEESNPYPANSIEYRYWADGWWAGFYQEPALFTLSGKVAPSLKHAHKITKIKHKHEAANHEFWTEERKKLWLTRAAQVALALFVAAAAYELAAIAA